MDSIDMSNSESASGRQSESFSQTTPTKRLRIKISPTTSIINTTCYFVSSVIKLVITSTKNDIDMLKYFQTCIVDANQQMNLARAKTEESLQEIRKSNKQTANNTSTTDYIQNTPTKRTSYRLSKQMETNPSKDTADNFYAGVFKFVNAIRKTMNNANMNASTVEEILELIETIVKTWSFVNELISKRIIEFEKIMNQSANSSSSNSSNESDPVCSVLERKYAYRVVEQYFENDWDRAIFVLQSEQKKRSEGSSSIPN